MLSTSFDQFLESQDSHDDHGVHALTLRVSHDGGANFFHLPFEGESSQYIDHQVSNYLAEHPAVLAEAPDDVCWAEYPKTFDALYSVLLARTAMPARRRKQFLTAFTPAPALAYL